jgi:hypothetical protein
VKKFETEINAWEDSPASPLSETLYFFIGQYFFYGLFETFLLPTAKKKQIFLCKKTFEDFAWKISTFILPSFSLVTIDKS